MKLLLLVAWMAGWNDGGKMLHPDFPVVDGTFKLTENWSVTLDQPHSRRTEDGSLVLWRPGFTIWMDAYNLKEGETPQQRFEKLKEDGSPAKTDVREQGDSVPLRFSYRLKEGAEDQRQPAYHGFVVGPASHLFVAIYFDDLADAKRADAIFQSLTPVK